MSKGKLVPIVAVLCAVAMFGFGCKRTTSTKGSNAGEEGIGIGEGANGGLAGRPGDMTPIQGQQMDTVLFAYDSAQVDAAQESKVAAAAQYLKSNASAKVTLEGNCDERGSREYNMALGERRALAVRTALVNAGIDASRIQTKSYGKEKPKDMGHDEAAWSVNRRVEFALFQ